MTRRLEIYSDGGGETGSTAAAACIVRSVTGEETRLVAFLGGATNNESEILGGLLGFSIHKKLHAGVASSSEQPLLWVSDSDYTLKSASIYISGWQKNGWKTASKQPVKNQGLWRLYLELRGGFAITFQHVRGHAGHPENELCDEASTWCRGEGARFLSAHPNGGLAPATDGAEWMVVDARALIDELRRDGAAIKSVEMLTSIVDRAFKACPGKSPAKAKPKKAEATKSQLEPGKFEIAVLPKILERLSAFCEELERRFGEEPTIGELLVELRSTHSRFSRH